MVDPSSSSSSSLPISNIPTSQAVVLHTPPIMPNLIHQLPIKLTSNNFLLWKTQLLPMLKGCGLACHLDNSAPPPPQLDCSNQINPAFTQWVQQDQLVLS
ncbi:hypothetical protein ACH5RR_029564 [Cinchona calisaya]|uniref:Retrotransposon Copia-like N-terminal domain-containing protein n=1 Tax=Cinchona calisaya TaxID=153742 RepID=A0ABD2YS45_9GENT